MGQKKAGTAEPNPAGFAPATLTEAASRIVLILAEGAERVERLVWRATPRRAGCSARMRVNPFVAKSHRRTHR